MELKKITQKMVGLASKRQELYKEFLAEKYGIVFAETQHLSGNLLFVVDDVLPTPYVGCEGYLPKKHNPTFVGRKVFKNGNVATSSVPISGSLKTSGNADKAKMATLSGKLFQIQSELIALNEERHRLFEQLYQKQKQITFGKSVFAENGEEFLIVGLNVASFVEKWENSSNLVRCYRILKTGKLSKTLLNRDFLAASQKEVRRLN